MKSLSPKTVPSFLVVHFWHPFDFPPSVISVLLDDFFVLLGSDFLFSFDLLWLLFHLSLTLSLLCVHPVSLPNSPDPNQHSSQVTFSPTQFCIFMVPCLHLTSSSSFWKAFRCLGPPHAPSCLPVCFTPPFYCKLLLTHQPFVLIVVKNQFYFYFQFSESSWVQPNRPWYPPSPTFKSRPRGRSTGLTTSHGPTCPSGLSQTASCADCQSVIPKLSTL